MVQHSTETNEELHQALKLIEELEFKDDKKRKEM